VERELDAGTGGDVRPLEDEAVGDGRVLEDELDPGTAAVGGAVVLCSTKGLFVMVAKDEIGLALMEGA